MTFEQFIRLIQRLKVDRSGGVPKPYKPLLLAAVVILIHKGEIRTREVFLDGGLNSVFLQLLRKLYPGKFETAKVIYPFRHLATDGVWKLVAKAGQSAGLAAIQAMGGEAWQVLKHVRCAQLDPPVFEALSSGFQNRFRVLQTLIQAYDLPRERTGLLWDLLSTEEERVKVPKAGEGVAMTERALEEHLETNWADTEFARLGIELSSEERFGLPCRQVLTPLNTIDLLGFRPSAREWWVFELKKGRSSDAVVGQIGRYMTWIAERAQHDESVRGAIIVGRADDKLVYSARSNERITLWEYDAALAVRHVAVNR